MVKAAEENLECLWWFQRDSCWEKHAVRQYQIKKQLFLDGAKDKQVVTSEDTAASHQKRRTATPYLPCYFAD